MMRARGKCENDGGEDEFGDVFHAASLRVNGKRESMPFSAMIPARKDEIKYLLPQFDRAFSALMEDLAQSGLLEETLVLVTSEMGRKPQLGDRRSGGKIGAGRDHWTACMSVLMAGGGIQGGREVGATDARAEYPKHRPIDPADVVKTVYHAMGVTNLEATDMLGRPYNLLEEGKPLMELFG